MAHEPVTAEIRLRINGVEHSPTIDTRVSLLDLLRERLAARRRDGDGHRHGPAPGRGSSPRPVTPHAPKAKRQQSDERCPAAEVVAVLTVEATGVTVGLGG